MTTLRTTALVTGNIGAYVGGTTLEGKDAIVPYLRTVYLEGTDDPKERDDDTIWAIYQGTPVNMDGLEDDNDKAEAIEIAVCQAIHSGTVPNVQQEGEGTAEEQELKKGITPPNISAAGIASRAVYAAARLSDPEFTAHVTAVLDAGETKKRGPLVIAADVSRLYTIEEILAMPIPGEDKGDNPDRYKKTMTVNGSAKKVQSSFYADMWDASDIGKEQRYHMDGIDNANADKKDAPPLYKRMTASERTAARARWSTRRSNGIAALRTAIMVIRQLNLLDTMPKVGWYFMTQPVIDAEGKAVKDAEGNDTSELMNTPRPIAIYNKKEPAKPTVVAVATLLSFNVAAALAAGGTMADLIETAGKEPTADGDENEDGRPALIEDMKEFMTQAYRMGHFVDAKNSYAKLVKAASDPKSGDEFVEIIGDLCIAFDGLWTHVQRRYEALKQASAAKVPNQQKKVG